VPAGSYQYSTIWLDAQDIVYLTATGEKYHSEGCRYLKESAIPENQKAMRALERQKHQ